MRNLNTTTAPARTDMIQSILLTIGVIWAIFLLDRFLPLELFGLVPRTLRGVSGIFAMPFLHADLTHIISNSLPLVFLLVLVSGSRANSIQVIIGISLFGGVLLWLFGRSANHIGASLLVFGLVSFLIFFGLFEKRFKSIVLSIIIVFLYGTTLLTGILPNQPGVSWDGHLAGAVAGGVMAWGMTKNRSKSSALI